jgi:hypothetical protein
MKSRRGPNALNPIAFVLDQQEGSGGGRYREQHPALEAYPHPDEKYSLRSWEFVFKELSSRRR